MVEEPKKCMAITRKGYPCLNLATTKNGFCKTHRFYDAAASRSIRGMYAANKGTISTIGALAAIVTLFQAFQNGCQHEQPSIIICESPSARPNSPETACSGPDSAH
jgi:hypothetical protein